MSFLRDERAVEYQKDEMLSPGDRLFHAEGLNGCIITILGFKTEINIDDIKNSAQNHLLNYSRFRSVVIEKRKWKETTVELDKHIIKVDFDPKMGYTRDEFLENYMTSLSTKPMDLTKPLWEFHVLNFKTCNANSTVLFRVHHSIGDGISLITLLLANSFQTNNPQALPSFPIRQNKQEVMRNHYSSNYLSRLMKWLLFFMRLLFNTLVDMAYFLATISSFLKDTNTPIKGAVGVELHPRRFFHRIINLDDIKTVKSALNMTVNDVILGITQGGLSHYLNRRYASNNKKSLDQKKDLPNNIRLRAAVMFSQNIKTLAGTMEKKLKVEMNNSIGFALLPLTVDLFDDPIDYIRLAKFQMDRKKLSLESHCSHFLASVLPKFIGYKFASAILYKAFINTTMLFSNVPGPTEEINLFEHPLAYIAPFVYGMPHGMTIHYQSYCKKMIISIAVDTNLIPDPHELCNDIENCLKTILKTT